MRSLAAEIKEGDVVRVIENLFLAGVPENRKGLIVQIIPSKDERIVDQACVMFPDMCRTLHVCHLRKIIL